MEQKQEFAERIHPGKRGWSPKMASIVGAIIGYDYGVRDRRGGYLSSIAITSDGYVVASSTASDGGGAFVGDVRELEFNLAKFKAELSHEDRVELNRIWKERVYDYRSGMQGEIVPGVPKPKVKKPRKRKADAV